MVVKGRRKRLVFGGFLKNAQILVDSYLKYVTNYVGS